MVLRIFGWSFAVSAAALVTAFLYGGMTAFVLVLILGILEVSLSFDNAVVNATVLERMSAFWQQIFLTIGILIAVFGMRLVFPLLIVGITANLGPIEAINLALEKGDPTQPGTYGYLLDQAHPQIAAFGGMFLLLLFLDYIFEDRDITWLSWLERPLARIGKLDRLSIVVAAVALVLIASFLAEDVGVVLLSGMLGLVTYLAVNGLGALFDEVADGDAAVRSGPSGAAKATGKAGFFLFLYLEVLDAAFSFDGVVGAFAITADPILIALGLGLIGAIFVRSLTVYLVRQGTLAEYIYLEHGAHWAIGALAVILLITVGDIHVNEIITGLVGVALIGAAWLSSLVARRWLATSQGDEGGAGLDVADSPAEKSRT
ncbi:MAG: DUF475 domain-containing protein [Geodermatophilaceae bacterium]|nr:DUF475 domain-containing protein [Geodermatophilaceae bacterium]